MLTFAVIGAITGAARQIAHNVALAVAFLSARPLGTLLGPKAAASFQIPLLFATVAATLAVFILVLMVVRYALTELLQRLISGSDPEDRSLDRALGFVLGGLKVLALAYVVLSALTFVEAHVTVAGRRLGLSPKGSTAFALARRYNLFEYAQFSAVNDLVELARLAGDPQRLRRLQSDPAYKALRKDPRFQQVLNDPAMRKALETGDVRPLLRSNVVLQFIQDPTIVKRLAAAVAAGRREPPEPPRR